MGTELILEWELDFGHVETGVEANGLAIIRKRVGIWKLCEGGGVDRRSSERAWVLVIYNIYQSSSELTPTTMAAHRRTAIQILGVRPPLQPGDN